MGLIFSLSLVGGAGAQQPSAPPAAASESKLPASQPDKVVIRVGAEKMTVSDLDYLLSTLSQQAQQNAVTTGRRAFGDQSALWLVLAQQALRDHLDADSELQRRMALDRLQKLANAEYAKLARDAKVDPDEISKYYDAHKSDYEEIEARRIIIRKKAADAKPGTPGLTAEDAKARTDQIREALLAGKNPMDVQSQFVAAADGFMDVDPRPWRPAQLPPEWQKALGPLKDGQFTAPLDLPDSVAMLQVVKRRTLELKDVSKEIENSLHLQKIQQAVADLKKKADVWLDDAFFAPPAPKPPPEQKPAGAPATPPAAATPPGADR